MKVSNGFDKDKGEVTVKIQTNLFKKYYNNFVGICKNRSVELPKSYKLEQQSPDTATISFPLPEDSIVKADSVGVDLGSLMSVVNFFAGSALRYELEHTEFIPVTEYPSEDLQKDIKVAVKNKRNLCVISSYSEYLKMEAEHRYAFKQTYVTYGTAEWAETVLMILNGEFEELKNYYEPKFVFTEWC